MKYIVKALRMRALCLVALLSVFVLPPIASAATSRKGPSWNDPQGLCGAIVYMPTKGWHNGGSILGWYCQSDLKRYGAVGPRGLPSTFQYSVTGSGYHRATKIKLWYNANNPRTLGSSLHQLAQYAKTLSANVAFKLSGSQLASIKKGQAFSASLPHARVKFSVSSGRIRAYTLSFSRK